MRDRDIQTRDFQRFSLLFKSTSAEDTVLVNIPLPITKDVQHKRKTNESCFYRLQSRLAVCFQRSLPDAWCYGWRCILLVTTLKTTTSQSRGTHLFPRLGAISTSGFVSLNTRQEAETNICLFSPASNKPLFCGNLCRLIVGDGISN